MTTNNVIPFRPKDGVEREWIPLPANARPWDRYDNFNVGFDTDLPTAGIFAGDMLTCQTSFELSEVKPQSVCILFRANKQFPARVEINDSTISVFGKQGITNYPFGEIEILAIVREVQRAI